MFNYDVPCQVNEAAINIDPSDEPEKVGAPNIYFVKIAVFEVIMDPIRWILTHAIYEFSKGALG